MPGYVALLRGVNVGGHRKVPMDALRELASGLGLKSSRTYLASGNLLFESDEDAGQLERRIETAIAERFGFGVDVLVRSAAQWSAYCAGNPMPEESADTPNFVMMTIGKRPATDADVEALAKKAGANERVERAGDAIWTWFGDGAGRSKIGAAPTGREVWTTRNWRTVQALAEMLGA